MCAHVSVKRGTVVIYTWPARDLKIKFTIQNKFSVMFENEELKP